MRTNLAAGLLGVAILVTLAAGLTALAVLGPAGGPDRQAADRKDGPAAAEPEPQTGEASDDAVASGEATGAEPAAEPPPRVDPGAAPRAADDPAGLAEQIVAAERTIRSGDRTREELAAAGQLQQAAYRRLAGKPEWRDEVLARVPEDLHSSVHAHTAAGSDLRGLHEPREDLPPWRIVEPAPADELLASYREAQAAFGVPWEYLAAINLVETRMGRIRGTSVAGAQGPMQFMPATWEAYGRGDVNDDRDAILAAGRYLAASGAPGDMASALFSYNRSQRYVRAVSAYAEQMRADPRVFEGYYHWQVYYATTAGDKLLPVGYDGTG